VYNTDRANTRRRYADCREEQAFYHKFWQVKEDEDDDEDDE
jgi:hypothetical protein